MRRSFLCILCGVAAVAFLFAQGMAKIVTVEPGTAKAGVEVTASGENLEKPAVEKLFLTDGKNDTELKITSQGPGEIKFTVPADVKPGSYRLMVLTGGDNPHYIEEPVKITIE